MRDDVEEFAARLRGLKDRTDRSYGSLARRLGMNTSTLHRYCAGDAVPQDFAPVERLAAFCGATPEERLELHRLWLSAVAARQRVRTAGAGTAGATVPEAGGAALVEGGGAEQTGGGPGTAEPDRDEAGPDGRRHDQPHPHQPSPSSSPAARPRSRRRRALVSAAVVCALLATLRGTSAPPDDRSSEADASRSAGPRTTAPGVPRRSAEPPAGASRSPGSPSPRRPDRPASPSATGSRPGPAATGLPLAWSTDSMVWEKGCDHDYVIDKPPAQVPPPPVEQDAAAWAATQGAVHGRQTRVRISVQGRSSTAVVLEALHVRVVSRGEPAAGNAYAMGQGCGGDLTPRRFTVDLDIGRPVARPEDGTDSSGGGRTVPAVHFPYRVSAEDPEVLLVDGTTRTYDARWYLELDWSCEGRTGTIRIDDHGRPFRTTAIEGMPHYWYGTADAGERAWVPTAAG